MLNGCPSTKKSSESLQCLLTKEHSLETFQTFADTLTSQPQAKQERCAQYQMLSSRLSPPSCLNVSLAQDFISIAYYTVKFNDFRLILR